MKRILVLFFLCFFLPPLHAADDFYDLDPHSQTALLTESKEIALHYSTGTPHITAVEVRCPSAVWKGSAVTAGRGKGTYVEVFGVKGQTCQLVVGEHKQQAMIPISFTAPNSGFNEDVFFLHLNNNQFTLLNTVTLELELFDYESQIRIGSTFLSLRCEYLNLSYDMLHTVGDVSFSNRSSVRHKIPYAQDCKLSYEGEQEYATYNLDTKSHVDLVLTYKQGNKSLLLGRIGKNINDLVNTDRRKIKSASGPAYLDGIGKIETKGGLCSGSLIAIKPGEAGYYVASAAHCFGDRKSEKLEDFGDISWTTKLTHGGTITKSLNLISYDFKRDVALLMMSEAISFDIIKPYLVDLEYFRVTDNYMHNLGVDYLEDAKKATAAGYSSDNYLGDDGNNLTFDDSLTIEKLNDYCGSPGFFTLETTSFSGASGGAFLMDVDLSDEGLENPYNQLYLIGIMSSDCPDDSTAKIYTEADGSHGSKLSSFADYDSLADLIYKKENKRN